MARLFYMSLPGVGDWSAAMRESGAQLAPYRSYLSTARNAADNRALSLAWRRPDADELRELDRRLRVRNQRAERRAQSAGRRRDRHPIRRADDGTWILLESRPDQGEEPETTFDAFLEAREVYEREPLRRGNARLWSDEARIAVRDFDREALALRLERAPTELQRPSTVPPEDVASTGSLSGPILFLRPNTWPLECQRRTLETLENCPPPRLAPLLRLVSTRPTWGDVEAVELADDAWVFLRAGADNRLRDGATEQREFVRRALGTPDFALLEGPPGSGKTTAICELIAQLARAGKRVLLVASTHVAVDNVLERLIAWQDKAGEKLVLPVRIGDENNITSETVAAWTLRNLLRTWTGELLDHLDRPHDVEPAGEAARRLLRGALTRSGAQSEFASLLLEASNLVCGTTIGILQHPAIRAARQGAGDIEPFDYLILDEASKTTFTEFLVPAAYARRWVIVGDRHQLSPYVEEQDLAENLQGLLPSDVGRGVAHVFAASSAVPRGRRIRSLLSVGSEDEARLITEEAEARGVEAVNLDRLELATLYGVDAAAVDLLIADVVFGAPSTIAAWEHRLPGDLQAVSGDVPELRAWEAHRRALQTRSPDEPVTWGDEVAWRLVRAYELRYNSAEQKPALDELSGLRPRTIGPWYFERRRPRTLRDGRQQTPAEALEEDLANIRRVSMPSILEILQMGAGSLGWEQGTALTDGLPQGALRRRMVSLSFQHRMHPHISAFPRAQFYSEGQLLNDASGMLEAREWGYSRYARHAVWLDIAPRRGERDRGSSGNTNIAEAEAVMEELQEFLKWAATAPYPGAEPDTPWEVAVLSFYKGQEKELRHRLQRLSGQRGNTRNFHPPQGAGRVHVTLCTADRFQGHEADLVLLSFVKSGSVGFLNSPNRLNVALTRARYQVVLIGHRSWMASEGCHSELLRSLGSSSDYSHNIGWAAP